MTFFEFVKVIAIFYNFKIFLHKNYHKINIFLTLMKVCEYQCVEYSPKKSRAARRCLQRGFFYVRMCLWAWLKLYVRVLDGECYVQIVPSTDVVVVDIVLLIVA